MRVVGSNSQFYRINDFATKTSETVDRFKVNLQTSTGIANQVLVAYLPQTTLATVKYAFTTTSQENNTRFKIVYQNDLLANNPPTFLYEGKIKVSIFYFLK